MGYLNNKLGYRKDTLSIRSKIKKDVYALIEPDGLVKNVVPGFENCSVTILGSPLLGAHFVDYLVHIHPGGKHDGFTQESTQTLLYVVSGECVVNNDETLTQGGYIYCPVEEPLQFRNESQEDCVVFLYKKKYDPIEGYEAHRVIGNVKDLEVIYYEDMKDVEIVNLLPSDLGFDMNFHILTFQPGASHGYIETHVQEHGAYLLSGKGMYHLDGEWMPVEKGDYIFMGAYCPQAAYAVGDEPLSYVYSKDCNRDIKL